MPVICQDRLRTAVVFGISERIVDGLIMGEQAARRWKRKKIARVFCVFSETIVFTQTGSGENIRKRWVAYVYLHELQHPSGT